MHSRASWAWAHGHAIEIAWTLFAAANLVAMFMYPSWVTVPFHLIWVSFTLVYGIRAWGRRTTVFALVLVGVATGILITIEGLRDHIFPARTVEVPLMTAMFAAMVWHVRRYLGALQRLREVSRANEELLDRERRFVQGASHELRTPITVALGHADLLTRSLEKEQDINDLGIVIDELGHLRRLTDQLLGLATLDEKSLLEVSDVEPVSLLNETLRRWSPVDRDWSVMAYDAATLRVDGNRLRAALDALVDNAVKHTETGDRIELSAGRQGPMCAVTVADSGPGIPPDDLDRAFDRFTRAESGRTHRRDGFGLGLALVKAVAESHGGSVRANTNSSGACITMVLPVAEQSDASQDVDAQGSAAALQGADGPSELPIAHGSGVP